MLYLASSPVRFSSVNRVSGYFVVSALNALVRASSISESFNTAAIAALPSKTALFTPSISVASSIALSASVLAAVSSLPLMVYNEVSYFSSSAAIFAFASALLSFKSFCVPQTTIFLVVCTRLPLLEVASSTQSIEVMPVATSFITTVSLSFNVVLPFSRSKTK